MYYGNLISAINSMFNSSLDPLYRSINKSANKLISDSYYLATGDELTDTTFYSSNVTDTNNSYKVVLGRSKNITDYKNEVLFIINEQIILCIIPDNVITLGGEYTPKECVEIFYNVFNFIVHNTRPLCSYTNTVYSKVLDNMAVYLTVYVIHTWYTNVDYDAFESIIPNKKIYERFRDADKNHHMDYSYIYGLLT